MIALSTPRLQIGAFTLEDAAFIVELLNDPGWLAHIGDRKVRTLDDARAYLNNGPLAAQAKLGFALWAARGLGFAREAAAAVLAHGLGALGLPRIVAITGLDNAASGRVLEAIGMRFARRLRVPGHEDDSLLYAASR